MLLVTSGLGWAGERSQDASKTKEVPAAFNKTFQWEEGVVGPKKRGIDHDKIAAMQEEGRRQDEAKRKDREAGRAPKAEHTVGVNDPASSKLPTMDIEKPAPAGSIHLNKGGMKKAAYSPPRERDAIDDALADNRGSADPSSGTDLDRLLSGKPAPSHKASPKKRARRRR
jgi:hypothetical protein